MSDSLEPTSKPSFRKLGLILLVLVGVGLVIGLIWWKAQPTLNNLLPKAKIAEPTPSATPLVVTPSDTMANPAPESSPEAVPTSFGNLTSKCAPVNLPTASPEEVWKRIDCLWPDGDKGDIEAIREIYLLLRSLRGQAAQNPGINEKLVNEKLAVTEINLNYREKMLEIDSYWGGGDTSPASVRSWAFAVEALEDLYGQTLPPAYQKNVKDKLYVAHLNYGKALQAAKRDFEAQGQFQRAQQIDPSRADAKQALDKSRSP